MKNLVYQSQSKVDNICIKVMNIMITLIGIILVHLFGYFTNNLDNLFIIILLLNESTIVLLDFMKMDDDRNNKKYLQKDKKGYKRKYIRRKSEVQKNNNTFEEDEVEYLMDENKYYRGKKCIVRWIGFIIFWYFSPMIKEFIFSYSPRWKSNDNNEDSLPEKNNRILSGIINSLMFIPKLLIIIYLTS